MKWHKMAVKMLASAASLLSFAAVAQTPKAELYLTPLDQYSRIGRSLAIRHGTELAAILSQVTGEIRSNRFELINLDQSPMAGIGFWANPGVLAPEARYLGLAARMNVRLIYFPDNNWGRPGDALDAFGKDLLRILNDSLSMINDNSVRGAVMVLVYSKAGLGDPLYWERAEAAVFYIPREPLRKFNLNRMTFQQLFDQSDIYVFKGPEQIQILFNEFLGG